MITTTHRNTQNKKSQKKFVQTITVRNTTNKTATDTTS